MASSVTIEQNERLTHGGLSGSYTDTNVEMVWIFRDEVIASLVTSQYELTFYSNFGDPHVLAKSHFRGFMAVRKAAVSIRVDPAVELSDGLGRDATTVGKSTNFLVGDVYIYRSRTFISDDVADSGLWESV